MPLQEQVSALMLGVAADVVISRFRTLAAHEIVEKQAGEIVTSVDREAELRLHDGLEALGLGASIVGEEAVELEPDLLGTVGDGLVWLIDPLDGTANFAAGREPFGMMVALVEDGAPLQGWLLDPLSGMLYHAERGRGATCNGTSVRARASGRNPPIAALGTHFLSPDCRARVHAQAQVGLDVVPVPRCAAASYPQLTAGRDDIALFQRTLPWDHAAGVLLVNEAGGRVTHWNREPYRVGGGGVGVLAAASQSLWQTAADILLAPEAGLIEMEVFSS